MWSTLIKAVTIWGALAIAAVINGVLREGVFIPALGETVARPLSAVILLAVVLALAWLQDAWSHGLTRAQAWMVGSLWLAMTLLFETLLGTMQGMTTSEILAGYHPLSPTLWLYVVLGIFVAPAIVVVARRGTRGG
jgi:hypothetical protein